MSGQILLFVAIGTVIMFVVELLCKKEMQLNWIRTILVPIILSIVGVASVALMFFIENGKFGGVSFFGAIFFVPILLFPASLLIKVNYKEYLDIAAPMVSSMLAVMKINCLISGCCYGKVLYHDDIGEAVRFPSQIVELVLALLIAAILVVCIKSNMMRNKLYPLFMIIYGATRFAANFYRETNDFLLGMGIGNMWAVISMVVGVLWMIIFICNDKKQTTNH